MLVEVLQHLEQSIWKTHNHDDHEGHDHDDHEGHDHAEESKPLIEEVDQVIHQVTQLIKEQKVISLQGDVIDLKVDTICIHGDGPNAILFSEAIYDALNNNNIEIKKY